MEHIKPSLKTYVDKFTGEILEDPLELRLRERSFKIIKHSSCPSSLKRPNPERGDILFFSSKSRFNLSDLVLNTRDLWTYFFTLTYHENLLDGKLSKQHLNKFFTAMRKENLVKKYIWVLEFQKRGSIHYHFFVDDHFKSVNINDTDLKIRSGISERFSGVDTEINFKVKKSRGYLNEENEIKFFKRVTYLWLLSSGQIKDKKAVLASTDMVKIYNKNFVNVYASKYLHKIEQKSVPVGCSSPGRFWGASRKLVNEYVSFNQEKVKDFKNDVTEILGLKNFSGTWLMLDNQKALEVRDYASTNLGLKNDTV